VSVRRSPWKSFKPDFDIFHATAKRSKESGVSVEKVWRCRAVACERIYGKRSRKKKLSNNRLGRWESSLSQ